ncbi:MAG: hypothetical protein R3E98_03620 [Gemmatimonadota bacterium]
MPLDPWSSLPSASRVWVFGTERALEPAEERSLLDAVDAFLSDWRAHGHPLRCAREWREGRFLLVGVDQASEPPSGCSIDAFVRSLKALEARLGVGLVGHGAIFYRTPDGDIERVERSTWRARRAEGAVGADTPVFDLTLTEKAQADEVGLERPASETWVGRAFA